MWIGYHTRATARRSGATRDEKRLWATKKVTQQNDRHTPTWQPVRDSNPCRHLERVVS